MEDIIALGDGRGNVTIVRLTSSSSEPKLDLSFTWSAEKDRQLLGVYWCKALECSHIFTADPRGVLKLWNIRNVLFSSTDIINAPQMFPPVAVFEPSFGARIMCLDASPEEEILIAGDKKGNITAYPFPKILVLHDSGLMQQKMLPCCRFKGAHGISSVTSVHIEDSTSDHIEIHTTGGDGCICFFKYGRIAQKIEFFGMRQVKELGTIQSIYTNLASESQSSSTYAIGFTSADFIIWDLENETKMAQVSCGGWRRPYSYYLGTVPEYQNCFAFVKDHDIHIHRHWAPTHDKKLLAQVLHLQFHGREVHSLCFINPASHSDPENSSDLLIATGCEDGTVRLTGFLTGSSGKWHSSKLLGEHVGGSAVRATCFIPETYTVTYNSCNYSSNGISDGIAVEKDETFLLISVGSKQVLTTWILQPRNAENRQVYSSGLDIDSKQNSRNLENVDSAMSFQWLTTHMPPKLPRNRLKSGHIKQRVEEGNFSVVQPNMDVMDHMENDWRYLSVTAFHLKHPVLRLTVCFVAVACSDATVVLRALLLPSRLWFDVAFLVPHASPVLVLRHIIINASHYKDDAGDRYLIASGSTDGSITFWNLTETIHGFMQLISETQPHMSIDYQKRPRTGRGSQGGRLRWRSLSYASKKRDGDMSSSDGSNPGSLNTAENSSEASGVENTQIVVHEASDSSKTEMPSSTQSCDIPELRPMHSLSGVHQSGVNCLHISFSTPDKSYCIISGGDDQSVQRFNFRVISSEDCLTTPARLNSHDNDTLKILYQHKVASAHSAAVKGIWTDGTWSFSTGLDQRVRCWKMGLAGQFTEYSHAIISVPEPETLDVFHDRAKRKYHIAVAGRGMQMVEFSPPEDD
ncbi:Transducin family protein / WD-40 repeat family protein [Zea mays]|uniref:Transducin family protein / WD-40 repeat family protein n=1 Tax=Zea mays TaxID=4577 RepID=A0A1D6PLG0_MAIZE|nr:Transducin family protein / WD-40 repeat family protein [Zea mays]AQL10034.1 Transducin family protein / WD-40 repeat family protein [Zea mays]AQL10037.1 Transducin family protein / WD-40 repeat family protein [Zea mays]AQL10039.1 Transducin family protein / WD-40 repeat family protein [Zea mays]